MWLKAFTAHGRIAQLVRAPASHAGGPWFESRCDHLRRGYTPGSSPGREALIGEATFTLCPFSASRYSRAKLRVIHTAEWFLVLCELREHQSIVVGATTTAVAKRRITISGRVITGDLGHRGFLLTARFYGAVSRRRPLRADSRVDRHHARHGGRAHVPRHPPVPHLRRPFGGAPACARAPHPVARAARRRALS